MSSACWKRRQRLLPRRGRCKGLRQESSTSSSHPRKGLRRRPFPSETSIFDFFFILLSAWGVDYRITLKLELGRILKLLFSAVARVQTKTRYSCMETHRRDLPKTIIIVVCILLSLKKLGSEIFPRSVSCLVSSVVRYACIV